MKLLFFYDRIMHCAKVRYASVDTSQKSIYFTTASSTGDVYKLLSMIVFMLKIFSYLPVVQQALIQQTTNTAYLIYTYITYTV